MTSNSNRLLLFTILFFFSLSLHAQISISNSDKNKDKKSKVSEKKENSDYSKFRIHGSILNAYGSFDTYGGGVAYFFHRRMGIQGSYSKNFTGSFFSSFTLLTPSFIYNIGNSFGLSIGPSYVTSSFDGLSDSWISYRVGIIPKVGPISLEIFVGSDSVDILALVGANLGYNF